MNLVNVRDVLNLFGIEDEDIYATRTIEDAIYDGTLSIIEAEPIRHGHWINRGDNSWECSKCHEISCCNGNYCVDCGARIEGVEEV